jgi:NhaP-type Na+/H+ or K+/H+ antiporter
VSFGSKDRLAAGAPSKMIKTFQILILLLAVISVVAFVAKRMRVPPAILLVITGVGLALIPGLPTLELAPILSWRWSCRPSSTGTQ